MTKAGRICLGKDVLSTPHELLRKTSFAALAGIHPWWAYRFTMSDAMFCRPKHLCLLEKHVTKNTRTSQSFHKALADAAKREEENTTLARFIKNFESRIYAQLSRQLVDSLFGENPAEEGSFQLFENLITWSSDGVTITMTIFNEGTGETTTITIPIGDFGF